MFRRKHIIYIVKHLHKTASVIISVLIMCSCLCLTSFAEEIPTLFLSAPLTELHPGDTFTLTVNMSGNPGIWSVAFNLRLDNDVFEYVGCERSGCISLSTMFPDFYDESSGTVKYNCFSNDYFNNMTENGMLIAVTYKVSEKASPGVYEAQLELDEKNTINVDLQLVSFDIESAQFKVAVRDGAETDQTGGSGSGTDTTAATHPEESSDPEQPGSSGATDTDRPGDNESDPSSGSAAPDVSGSIGDAVVIPVTGDSSTAVTDDAGDAGDAHAPSSGFDLRAVIIWCAVVLLAAVGVTVLVVINFRKKSGKGNR